MAQQTTQSTISAVAIVISILGSSVLAAGLTKFFDFVFSNIQYKRDYYKIILSKRVEAYESVINKLNELIQNAEDIDGRRFHVKLAKGVSAIEFYNALFEIKNDFIWLSQPLADVLIINANQLSELLIKYNISQKSSDDECLKFSKEIYSKIVDNSRLIHLQVFHDLRKLHKVDVFFKEDIKNLKRKTS